MPEIIRVDVSAYKPGGYEYKEKGGVVVMEAERLQNVHKGIRRSGQLFLTWDVLFLVCR